MIPSIFLKCFTVEDGADNFFQMSVSNYHSTARKVPKGRSSQVFIIFDAILPKQHVGNDAMGTAALGAKEPGHGRQFRPLHSHVTAPSRCLADSDETNSSGGTQKVRCCPP